ncbi:MAG: T9SS type A sorting domain-containing protein, partial [Ignavibacteriaceae bacterium]|nr:T9SS type A sorting domain-containing protein [Ignavibacteriaceae bacterium]
MYPYKGSGSNINYKTDGTVPQFSLPTSALPSGLLFEHNFDYGSNIADYGWSLHSGGSTPINTTSGLTYTGYISSGIGNAANITGTSDDLNQGFVDQNSSGSIYLSALVSVTEAADNITGDYFLHLGDRTDPTTFTSFCARVFARVDASGNVNFGLSNTSTATWGATNYLKNTTYLLTVKYALNTSGNDDASLWIFSSGVPSDEIAAGTPEVSITGQTGQDIVDAIGLRQASSNQPDLILDGIRISTSWSQAPLPVELTSFTGTAKGKVVSLNWSTKTEVNNYGFEILRSDKTGEWEKIGFVAGSGNSNSPKEYSYTDSKTTGYGKYSYKLKQIDNDGKYTYTKEVEVDLGIVKEYELSQNYPNPFNPSTVIRYAIPQSGNVKLSVYNILGQEVKVLTEGYKEAGSYEVTFDGEGLGSGLYIYKL